MTSPNGELVKVANLFGGEDAVKIVNALVKLKEATDEAIATESNVKLNTVRKILYKFYDRALVSCTRVQDEKTGWFIFYWKFQTDQLDAFIKSRIRRTISKLKTRLEYEKSNSFFICKNCHNVRVPFDEAIESAFRCMKCGEHLTDIDNERIVEFLSNYIVRLEGELHE